MVSAVRNGRIVQEQASGFMLCVVNEGYFFHTQSAIFEDLHQVNCWNLKNTALYL